MAKKAGAKAAKAKKATKKAAGKKVKKAAVQPSISAPTQEPVTMTAPAQEVTSESPAVAVSQSQEQQEPAPVAEAKEEPKAETAAAQEAKETKADEKKEDAKMGSEKGIGKEYDPSEFSQPAAEAGSGGGSKVFLYVGISVVVLAVIVGGLFFLKGWGKESSELTGSTVTAFCSDTDGGYNRFTKGVAEGTYYLDYKTGQFMDECAPNEENKLTEYYCKNDLVVYATEPCPDGLTCLDGICA